MKIETETSAMKSIIVKRITEKKFRKQILKYILGSEDVSLNSLTKVKICDLCVFHSL